MRRQSSETQALFQRSGWAMLAPVPWKATDSASRVAKASPLAVITARSVGSASMTWTTTALSLETAWAEAIGGVLWCSCFGPRCPWHMYWQSLSVIVWTTWMILFRMRGKLLPNSRRCPKTPFHFTSFASWSTRTQAFTCMPLRGCIISLSFVR